MSQDYKYSFPGQHTYDGITLGAVYKPSVLDRVKKFNFKESDILIAGYPKSGRSWLEETVWLLQNDLDWEAAGQKSLRGQRVIPMDISIGQQCNLDRLESMGSPRIMSTFMYGHFFKDQLQGHVGQTPKVIVMLRNPKDVLVSYFHFYRMAVVTGNFPGTWDQFFQLARSKSLNVGDWFDHVSGWWNLGQDKPNFLFVHFEDFLENPQHCIKEIASFLGKSLTSENLALLEKHTLFENMRDNPTTNMKDVPTYKQDISEFFRKGVRGDWKLYMTEEQSNFIDQQYNKFILNDGLQMSF